MDEDKKIVPMAKRKQSEWDDSNFILDMELLRAELGGRDLKILQLNSQLKRAQEEIARLNGLLEGKT